MRYSGYKTYPYGQYNGYPDHLNCISSRGDTDDDLSKRNIHGRINAKANKASEALTKMHL
jgi:hypothetical protein